MLNSEKYLHHTEGAVKQLFYAIDKEYLIKMELVERLTPIEQQAYTTALDIQVSEGWNRKKLWDAREDAKYITEYIELSDLTIGALCGAILQIAKQGISLNIPNNQRFSKGKLIGNQPLSKVLWNARNQSMHFEESLNSSCKNCFEALDNDFNLSPKLSDRLNKNLSFDVFELIKWRSYDIYLNDMTELFELNA